MHLCVLIKTVAAPFYFSLEVAINRFPGPAPGKPIAPCLLAQCKMPRADAGSKPATGSWRVRRQPPSFTVLSWPMLLVQVEGRGQSYACQNEDAETAPILLFILCSSNVCCLIVTCSFMKRGMLFQSWCA